MTVKFRVQQTEVVREFEFDRDTITFGRGPTNDVVVADERVARRHGSLSLDADGHLRWTCATGGIAVLLRDDTEIDRTDGGAERQWQVREGDVVRLGEPPDPVATVEILVSDVAATPDAWYVKLGEPSLASDDGRLLAALAARLARAPEPAAILRTFHELLALRGLSDGEATLVLLSGPEEYHNDAWALNADGTCGQRPDPTILLGTLGPEISERWRHQRSVAVVDRMAVVPLGQDELDAVIVYRSEDLDSEVAQIVAKVGAAIRPYAEIFVERYRLRRRHAALVEENRYFRARQRQHYLYKELVCESEAMRALHERLRELRDGDEPVLIAGEAGTGKELLARLLHHSGSRAGQMILKVNCAEYADESANLELFGSSADDDGAGPRKGVFELALDGTVILEELDLLPPMVQAKLRRTLKESEVRRVGESVGRPIRARFVATVHRDVSESVAEGRLRRDVFLLLRERTLTVPPLRERTEDILPLAENFLGVYASRYGRSVDGFTRGAKERMLDHAWPGNVRELQARIEAAVLGTSSSRVDASHLGLV